MFLPIPFTEPVTVYFQLLDNSTIGDEVKCEPFEVWIIVLEFPD
ncbi:MAG TPA: hypothetical protein VLM37_00010 [Fibrobacteraceae bacterium]|nr:hypothetical protein [Fibrobacteraceae bacterium]